MRNKTIFYKVLSLVNVSVKTLGNRFNGLAGSISNILVVLYAVCYILTIQWPEDDVFASKTFDQGTPTPGSDDGLRKSVKLKR